MVLALIKQPGLWKIDGSVLADTLTFDNTVVAETHLPEEIVAFINGYIKSLEHLEVLLLVSSASGSLWTPQRVYEVIQSSESSVRQRLLELCARGWLSRESDRKDEFTFQPPSPELRRLLRELAFYYKECRVRVVETIYGSTPSAAQGFSEAFRLRKDK